jgi:thiamine-monophosphate kinase
MANEFERIRRLQALFGAPPVGVVRGIGDDAAVIDLALTTVPDGKLVWTIDTCIEHVHFNRSIAGWDDVGWRSFMAAASDLAAMAARPVGALCALALPTDLDDEALDALAHGQRDAAISLHTAIVGGNLSRGDEVSVTTTLLGIGATCPLRSGARAGELVALAGDVGLAAAGLRWLLRDPLASPDPSLHVAVQSWLRPVARIDDGLRAGPVASALIDVSDGLAQDALHVAEASSVRIDLEPDAFVGEALMAAAALLGVSALELALHGGEDYALLGTFPEGRVPDGFVVIGSCGEGEGVWVRGRRVHAAGHDHFRA